MESLGYAGVLRSLRSLRGEPADVVAPAATGVRYRAAAGRGIEPLADLYLPANPSGASVVLVHGGGFVLGSRTMKPMRLLAARLSRARIGVCAIDYRMIFRGGRLDEALDDVAAAHEFWGERVAGYGLDPARISMIGLSAGGTLAMLAAARAAPGTLHRLVSCFGLYEIDHLQGPASVLPRLLFRSADRNTWRMRSPGHADQARISTLLLHGDDDRLVPVEQARRLAARREGLGLPTKLVVYPGAPHAFFNIAGSPAADAATSELIDHVSGQASGQVSGHLSEQLRRAPERASQRAPERAGQRARQRLSGIGRAIRPGRAVVRRPSSAITSPRTIVER